MGEIGSERMEDLGSLHASLVAAGEEKRRNMLMRWAKGLVPEQPGVERAEIPKRIIEANRSECEFNLEEQQYLLGNISLENLEYQIIRISRKDEFQSQKQFSLSYSLIEKNEQQGKGIMGWY